MYGSEERKAVEHSRQEELGNSCDIFRTVVGLGLGAVGARVQEVLVWGLLCTAGRKDNKMELPRPQKCTTTNTTNYPPTKVDQGERREVCFLST